MDLGMLELCNGMVLSTLRMLHMSIAVFSRETSWHFYSISIYADKFAKLKCKS